LTPPNLTSGSVYRVSERPTHSRPSSPQAVISTRRMDLHGNQGRLPSISTRIGLSASPRLTPEILNVSGPASRLSALILSLFGTIVSRRLDMSLIECYLLI